MIKRDLKPWKIFKKFQFYIAATISIGIILIRREYLIRLALRFFTRFPGISINPTIRHERTFTKKICREHKGTGRVAGFQAGG